LNVYSGDEVTANDWNWNRDGAYGIIGLGPLSEFWSGFTAPATDFTATYSIELARFSNPLSTEKELREMKATSTSSNITLGSANDAYY
jgi:hypothetical protein